MLRWFPLLAVGLIACPATPSGSLSPTAGTSDTVAPSESPQPCGKGEQFDLTVHGVVVDDQDVPTAGVDVRLEERNWRPGTYGTAVSKGEGRFTIVATGMPLLFEDCWGTGVQFFLAGETDTLEGDQLLNAPMLEAVRAGTEQLELAFPLYLSTR